MVQEPEALAAGSVSASSFVVEMEVREEGENKKGSLKHVYNELLREKPGGGETGELRKLRV